MKRVLVVSPHFPPLNAPDMQRVRTSLPFFRSCGWQPYVLAVRSDDQPGVIEPRLVATLPKDVTVTETKAWPLAITQRLGIGNVALRAFVHLYNAGARLIRQKNIDLVYISTTMFAAMALGRLWKWRFGTPYVLDMQDPWVIDVPATSHRLPKHRQAQWLHGLLEPFTMRGVGGLITVSAGYTKTLRRRYPWITHEMCTTVPFGACEEDLREAARGDWANPFFDRRDGLVHAVYAGAVSDAMRIAATILFRAVHKARGAAGRSAALRLSFVGTSYASSGQPQKMVEADAAREAVGDVVRESPGRIPYFDALRLMLESDVLIILGSADSDYTPSKLFQCVLTKRPIVAVLHADSPIVDVLRRSRAAVVTTFTGEHDIEAASERLSVLLVDLLERPPAPLETDESVIAPFTAAELTRQQCAMFDAVLRTHSLVHGVPCPE